MPGKRQPKSALLVVALVLALVSAVSGCASKSGVGVGAAPSPPGALAPVRDTHEMLDGVLWMETSAEYWALTTSIYSRAIGTLATALRDREWTAALEQTGPYEDLPPAVILDLDETVLDNSRFQGQLVLDRTTFSPDTWSNWVRRSAATLVPGAKEFLDAAARSNVKVYFVTSRTVEQEPDTLKNLQALGVDATDDDVLSQGDGDGGSDKSGRRALIARSHRVLLLVGDDLGDFVPSHGLAPGERLEIAQSHRDWWAARWVLLPNPLYGSWERALYAGASGDDAVLAKKRALVRGTR